MAKRARPPLARRAPIAPQPARLWEDSELRWERPRRRQRARPLSLVGEPQGSPGHRRAQSVGGGRRAAAPTAGRRRAPESARKTPSFRPGPAAAAAAAAPSPAVALARPRIASAKALPPPLPTYAPPPPSPRQIHRARRRAAVRARRRRTALAWLAMLAAVGGVLTARMHGAGRSLGPGAEPSAAAAGPSAPSRPRPGAIHRRAHERALLHRIARCESSFRPGLIYDAGRYRGAFQFDIETWRSVGGRGDPAAAPPSEQRRRALILLRRRGLRPWPVCGPRAANRP